MNCLLTISLLKIFQVQTAFDFRPHFAAFFVKINFELCFDLLEGLSE